MKISIWVTKICNMDCSYCYENGITRKDETICEDEYIENVIRFINNMCTKISSKKLFIKFFGGEPLIQFSFIERFVELGKQKINKGIKVFYSITTNGTLMTDYMIQWFEKNYVECALSIDGDESVYNTNRRYKNNRSAWEDINALIPKLLQSRIKLSARMTYNSKTVAKLTESCEYLLERGFKLLKAVPDYFDVNWDEKSILNLEEQIKEIEDLKVRNGNIYINLDDDDLFIGRKGCAGGYSMFSIDLKGNIYPCTYVMDNERFLLGNLSVLDSVQPQYTDGTALIRENCEGCRYYKCCKSVSCLYGNYKMSGQMDKTNDFFCSYRKILYKLNEEKIRGFDS